MDIKLKSATSAKVIPVILIVGSFIFSFLLSCFFPTSIEKVNILFRKTLFNIRYTIKGREEIYPRLVNIGFSDFTYEKLAIRTTGEFRKYTARILEILNREKAGPVGMDVIFTGTVNDESDGILKEAIEAGEDLFLPVITGHEPGAGFISDLPFTPWLPEIKRSGSPGEVNFFITSYPALSPGGWGYINFPGETPVHRLPLVRKWKEGYIPSISFALVCRFLNVAPEQIIINFGKEIIIRDACFPGRPEKNIIIPIDEKGQMLLNFPGPWTDSFLQTTVHALLDEPQAGNFLKDSIVFVADCSSRGKDFTGGFYDRNYPSAGIHLTAMNMILTENFLNTSGGLYNFLIAAAAIVLLIISLHVFRKIRWQLFFSLLTFLLFLLVQGALFIFFKRISLFFEPGLGILFSIITSNIYFYFEEKKNRGIVEKKFGSLIKLLSGVGAGEEEAFLAARFQALNKEIAGVHDPRRLLERCPELLPPPVVNMAVMTENLAGRREVVFSGPGQFFFPEDLAAGSSSLLQKKLKLKTGEITLLFSLPEGQNFSGEIEDKLAAVTRNLKPMLENYFALREAREGAYQIIHELKNTSFSVNFILDQLIKKLNTDEKTINRLTMITREMSRLYDFSTKHLDYALMNRRGQWDITPLDPSPLLEEVVARGRDTAGLKEITLTLTVARDLSVPGDKSSLSLLFYNLIENAVKYSPGGTEVDISGIVEGQWFCFRVRDRGPGFAKQAAIYEKKKGFTSHGVGLKLCILIVDKHNGVLEINNKETGAEVLVRLPI